MSFTRGKMYFSDSERFERDRARERAIDELSGTGIKDATVYSTQGIWNGASEYGFVLETLNAIGPEAFIAMKSQLEELAELLRYEFNQTSVLVTVEIVDGDMIFVEETNK